MKLRVCSLTIGLIFAQVSAVAQWADYGLGSSVSVSQKVAKKTSASLDFAARFNNNFSVLGTTFVDSEISREVLDDVNLGAAIRVGGSQTDEYHWESRLRLAFNAKYKTKVGDKSSLSFRLQDPHHIFDQTERALQLRGLGNLGGELHPRDAFTR